MFKKFVSVALAVVAPVVALAAPTAAKAAAAGPDLTPLTSNIDFGTVITAVLAIAGLLSAVYLAIKGAKIVLSMVKSA